MTEFLQSEVQVSHLLVVLIPLGAWLIVLTRGYLDHEHPEDAGYYHTHHEFVDREDMARYVQWAFKQQSWNKRLARWLAEFF